MKIFTQRITWQAAIRVIVVGVILSVMAGNGMAADLKEGGYIGSKNEGNEEVVYNFLKHFNYEQYYYAYKRQFSYNNNKWVDAMDFAFFSGHGNKWLIATMDGTVDLKTAGYSSHQGWGNIRSKFVAFESCKVVPSPLETSSWWQPWVKPENKDLFDGVRQVLGFRSYSYMSTDQDIAYYLGARMQASASPWRAWFQAISRYGLSDEYGSAVMYPRAENDTYGRFSAKPPAASTWLKVWYQY